MTSEESARMDWLCLESRKRKKDPKTFDAFIQELNELPEIKHGRIHPEHRAK
jgi:hypothetical protein